MSKNLSKIVKFKPSKARNQPQLFFFTDRKQFSNIFKTIENLPKNSVIIIREYDLEYTARLLFAKEIVKIARKKGLKVLAGKSLKLHLQAGTDGIHFSDRDQSWRQYLFYRKNNAKLLLSCACHDEKSIRKAQKFGINFIFVSPIFRTNSHPNSKIIGHQKLAKISGKLGRQAPIYALGGINENNVKLLRKINIAGIGFISLAKS